MVLLLPTSSSTLGQGDRDDRRRATSAAVWKADIAEKEREIGKRLSIAEPDGEYYQARVPDTLDLAQRGALALNALTGQLDPTLGYELYPVALFASNPAYMTHGLPGGYADVPKVVEALPQMRLISGSKQKLDVERSFMLRLMAMSWDDGLLYSPPAATRPWMGPGWAEVAHANLIGRLLLAMLYWYQYDGNSLWLEHAQKIYQTMRRDLIRLEGADGAYAFSGRSVSKFKHPDKSSLKIGAVFHQGIYTRAVAKYAMMTGDAQALELARKLAYTLRRPEFWPSSQHLRGVVESELAHSTRSWEYHVDAMALRGLLEYALASRDEDVKQFVRRGYEYRQGFGIPEIGWFQARLGFSTSETCGIADMLILAVKLTDAGVGDYWDDVDRKQLEQCSAASFPYQVNPPQESAEQAIERSLGTFANVPYLTDYPGPWAGPCCNHNGAQALYHAWEAIVRDQGKGTVQINLLLNRAAAHLDMDSYLPYQGKVVIRNKTAQRIHLRIPNWVSKAEVRCRVDGASVAQQWLNNYLILEGLQRESRIVVEFPMIERTIRRTEGGSGTLYTIHLRGNTVVDLSPRPKLEPAKLAEGKLTISRPARAIRQERGGEGRPSQRGGQARR